MVKTTGHSLRACSGRCSRDEDSGLGAGAVGSSERHAQGEIGAETPTPAARRTVVRSTDSGDDPAFAGSQQHSVEGRLAQQAPETCETIFVVQAVTSPVTDIIPTIATTATVGRRR